MVHDSDLVVAPVDCCGAIARCLFESSLIVMQSAFGLVDCVRRLGRLDASSIAEGTKHLLFEQIDEEFVFRSPAKSATESWGVQVLRHRPASEHR